jgi:hypothetical protein
VLHIAQINPLMHTYNTNGEDDREKFTLFLCKNFTSKNIFLSTQFELCRKTKNNYFF